MITQENFNRIVEETGFSPKTRKVLRLILVSGMKKKHAGDKHNMSKQFINKKMHRVSEVAEKLKIKL